MLPAEAFATRTQRKVLRVLAEKNKQYTIAELADMCHRSESTVSRATDDLGRFPFVERNTVSGSKTLVCRIDPESPYSTPIVEFFETERRIERRNGTVPVDVWNLVEDIVLDLESNVEGFVEAFLFGSYASGEYYTGSDVDLLLMHAGTSSNVRERIHDVIEDVSSDVPVQVVTAELSDRAVTDVTADELLRMARDSVALADGEPLIPLMENV